MPYFTKADLAMRLRDRRIAELTTDSGETPSDDFIDTLAVNVSDEVDGYLLSYAPPVSDSKVKAILREHALNIAVYRLLLRGLISGDATQDAKDAADQTYSWLKMVAKGEIALPVSPSEPVIPEATTLTTAGGDEAMFDKDPGNVL